MTYRISLMSVCFALLVFAAACGGTREPASPLETFKTYTKALKQKDLTVVKRLLTEESIKMYEQEARAQGVTVDDVVSRDSLISQGQTTVEFRNEAIDGERATIEVKNTFGQWDTIPFVFEGGEWKIDMKGHSERLIREIEEQNRKQIEDAINQGRPDPMDPLQQPAGLPTPDQPY
ncbi:MAG TPA: DUF4878 domain-containing protein [Pyrinomonadaceae bacterium]|nr:DUF4878 domain-containing protein [Pyrinomonadaceae bacterium]HMP65476.1 DUF4878 domain-containing protein [Pyrinomonadaceae bacterium]